MKVSVNWTKKYISVDLPIDKLVEKIGAQLGAVEEVFDLGKKYDGILIVKVVKCEKHPDADKLSLCLVDDVGVNKKVKRAADGLIQVVCGALNVKAGQLAVWIPPGVAVPNSVDKEPFVIEAREIRGQMSNGMLASLKELAIGESHDGILVLDSGKPGDSFAKNLLLDDYIIDIENKMFTHRPDLFGQLGVARELAGIQQQSFKSPAWYREDASLPADGRKNVLKLTVKNGLPKLVPRFCAVAIKDIKVGPSPAWLQAHLSAVGVRPINNIVDITNFFMLETAQPLHAYDYDKLKTGVLGVRLAKKGEQLKLIGDKTIKLDHEAIVITDGTKPVGLGGVMGGADTEVDQNTKNIVLEAATFDMNTTRRAAMAYGLFTDAATRFTKNQSPRQNMAVMAYAAQDINRIAGGRIASPVIDGKHYDKSPQTVKVSPEFINLRLGLALSAGDIKKILENVEFKVETGKELKITVPFWRTDIEIPEDIVEEVGRLYGYDKLPVVLPPRDLAPAPKDAPLEFKAQLRDLLAQAGANEVLTYSFVHRRLLEAAGQNPDEAYHIRNAVSPDLQYYRLSLAPSLLEKIHPNQKNGYDRFALFEIGKGHLKGQLDDDKLPAEFEVLGLAVLNPYSKGAAFYQAKVFAEHLFDSLNIEDRRYLPLTQKLYNENRTTWHKAYQAGRSAGVWSGDSSLGIIGEPTPQLRTALKLPKGTAMFELDIAGLYEAARNLTYRPLNRFPASTQDICLRMPVKIEYGQADRFVWDELEKLSKQHGYNYEMETLDIFQRPKDKDYHQITWRITLSHPERTLTTEEVNKLLDGLSDQAKKALNAERI